MIGLYDKDWNLIDVFDTDGEALSHAIYNGIPHFRIRSMM